MVIGINKLYTHIKHAHVPRNINLVHEHELQGFNSKLAVVITRSFGTMWAFYLLVLWMFLWMGLASIGFWLFTLDRYPFPFLLFLSNLVQLWALPVLAVGQQVLSRKQELQADEMFATTQHSFADIEQIMSHLDKQDDVILEILRKLEGGSNSEPNAKQEAASAITAPFDAIHPSNIRQP